MKRRFWLVDDQRTATESVAWPIDFVLKDEPAARLRLHMAADRMEGPNLAAILRDSLPADSARFAPLLVAGAREAWTVADGEKAVDLAERALLFGASGPDAREARAILDGVRRGELPGPSRDRMRRTGPFELAAPVSIGALLPVSGSPAVRRYAQLLEEGIRVALEGEGAPEGLSLRVLDDGGQPERAVRALRELDEGNLVGIIGPLLEEELLAVADARQRVLPLVSPTARGTLDREGVYSLEGPDPGAAHALAEYAVDSGLEQVVVIHPATEAYAWEAETFRTHMLALGGSVLRVLSYPPGTTTFGEVLEAALHLDPRALVMPAPPEDIVALAPQVSFFGLDTLGIRVLGTAEWTSDAVLRDVAPRHTDGVVVATSRTTDGRGEGYEAFEAAYESHFQRSLRDPVPALGYDAARLLLQGLRSGARNADELLTALEWVEDFQGATGLLSVEEGQVLRRHRLVCIQDRELRPVEPGERTTYYRPERRGDPEAGEPERVPLGPPQLYCPGVPAPDAPGRPGGAPEPDTTALRSP
jgi:ABC-type branched-subunit amino acid transport system substrate-binding protein